jgi:oligopeptidase B
MNITPKKHLFRKHNHTRNDPYYWLHRKNNSLVTKINQQTNDSLCDLSSLQNTIIQEIKDRSYEDDESILTKYKQYYYFYKIKRNENYPRYYIQKTKNSKSYCYFDPESLSKKYSQFKIGPIITSYDEKYILYSVDYTGDLKYTLFLKEIFSKKTKKIFDFQISNNYLFHPNNTSFYYVQYDTKIRKCKLYHYDLITHKNTFIFEEKEQDYSIYLSLSTDEKYIFLYSTRYENDHIYLVEDLEIKSLFHHSHIEYSIDHYKDKFYLLTNKDKKINFELYESDNLKSWRKIVKHSNTRYIQSFFLWYDSIFLSIRENGFPKLIRLSLQNYSSTNIDFLPAFSDYSFPDNLNPNNHKLKISYSTYSQPTIIYEYDLKTSKSKIIKHKKLKNHNPNKYNEGYFKIGKLIVNYLYHKDKVKLDGKHSYPCYLYGYGAYGVIDDPSFDKYTMSLVDRGYLYCIPHLRGTKFYGPQWYQDGKLLKKKNTFKDFQTTAEYLIKNKYTSPDKLVIEGGSAGGLLVGACLNMNPSLYNVAIMRVPYVDCLTTMLNPDIPLTSTEYSEWGNPTKYKTHYDYILSYSPYDNIDCKKKYPHIYIDTGLNDSQVQFFEPLKYFAKMNQNIHFKNQSRTILMDIKSDSGHSGSSKRYQSFIDESKVLSFILKYN